MILKALEPETVRQIRELLALENTTPLAKLDELATMLGARRRRYTEHR